MSESLARRERLRRALAAAGLNYRAQVYSRVSSTQDLALRAAARGAPGGSVFIADVQLAGRGRQGRSWVAPAGTSVMLSVLWRPPSLGWSRSTLALTAGLAVAEGIERAGGPPTALKWPNDCLVSGRKVAGVLVETASGAEEGRAVVVGIGCNLTWRGLAQVERPGVGATAIDLEGRPVEFDDLALSLLVCLDTRYRQWCDGGFEAVMDDWLSRLLWMGEDVVVRLPDLVVQGRMVGVSADGRLRLRHQGDEILIAAGDLESGEAGGLRLGANLGS
ncbi:MAG: biotin--[acetyl-CoA-carboxylase] ligase [Candidatus Dormibacteria bacterium]